MRQINNYNELKDDDNKISNNRFIKLKIILFVLV